MDIQELREFIEAKRIAGNDKQIILAKRASEALETGVRIIDAFGSLGERPDANVDFWGWDNWWSDYVSLAHKRARCDGILSVCLEAMGLDYRYVQNVIKQATHINKDGKTWDGSWS